eukprot:SRR837773.21857.p1 GENE.SRR837773.21857~~SRR837773.21857.p1  ORF type:complete len:600 (+),score=83.73 SRR837773.21857:98-1801(+)
MKAVAEAAGVRASVGSTSQAADAIKRDGQAMHTYYSSWDQFDADAEAERLDEEVLDQQRAEQRDRQALKDRILDELAIQGDGDRTRTSKARPRVKVAVRMSGRRASPVDLAEPRKLEANGYFSSGRYREAVAAYSAALDLLEKYEPPEAKDLDGDGVATTGSGVESGDCAGQETEALKLKATLLANRAAAFLKLEEWRMVVEDCTEAMRFEPDHGKATLRRGFALARMKRWAVASRDLERAVAWDPGDKKAAAELQMARRMLREQAKEARAHACRSMCDPTRQPLMPTRRLAVRVHRGCLGQEVMRQAAVEEAASPCLGQVASFSSSAPAPLGQRAPEILPERRQYVPRAVRMRGGSLASVGQASADSLAEVAGFPTCRSGNAVPGASMNFYSFEAQWARHRSRPAERLALLRRIGAAGLPALFRESLDPELLCSITEVLASEVAAAEPSSEVYAFAADTLAALSRTPRFELSYHGLSHGERSVCLSLLDRVSAAVPGCTTSLVDVRRCFEQATAPLLKSSDMDEDDVELEPDRQSLTAAQAEALFTEAVPLPAADGVAAFSLDDCD